MNNEKKNPDDLTNEEKIHEMVKSINANQQNNLRRNYNNEITFKDRSKMNYENMNPNDLTKEMAEKDLMEIFNALYESRTYWNVSAVSTGACLVKLPNGRIAEVQIKLEPDPDEWMNMEYFDLYLAWNRNNIL